MNKILKSNLLTKLEEKQNNENLPFEEKRIFKAYNIVNEMKDEIECDRLATVMAENHLCPSLFLNDFICKEQEYFGARCEACWKNALKYSKT